MVRTWALEMKRAGVTVNAVIPVAATAMTATVPYFAAAVEAEDARRADAGLLPPRPRLRHGGRRRRARRLPRLGRRGRHHRPGDRRRRRPPPAVVASRAGLTEYARRRVDAERSRHDFARRCSSGRLQTVGEKFPPLPAELDRSPRWLDLGTSPRSTSTPSRPSTRTCTSRSTTAARRAAARPRWRPRRSTSRPAAAPRPRRDRRGTTARAGWPPSSSPSTPAPARAPADLERRDRRDRGRAHADVLIPFGSVDPLPGADAIDQRTAAGRGVTACAGFKFHPTVQGFDPSDDEYGTALGGDRRPRGAGRRAHRPDRHRGGTAAAGAACGSAYSNPMLLDEVAAELPRPAADLRPPVGAVAGRGELDRHRTSRTSASTCRAGAQILPRVSWSRWPARFAAATACCSAPTSRSSPPSAGCATSRPCRSPTTCAPRILKDNAVRLLGLA